MASFEEIISTISIVYSDVIEPILCLLYAYMLTRIFTAKSLNFRSEFYVFTIATGLFLTIVSMLSHIFALSISIGKTLSVATRFTGICLIHRKNLWGGHVIPVCLLAMFGVPILANCYFPAFPYLFTPTPNGYGQYMGIANPGFLIAKAFATSGYFFFFFTTVPMCVLSVLKLRSLRSQHTSSRPAKMLAMYAVVLTTSHMFKSVIQTIWFGALVLNMKDVQAPLVSLYLIPNTLSAFAEPVLLLVTSTELRKERLGMASFHEIFSITSTIYSDVIEPILCVFYAFILVRIVTAKSLNFRSEFYVFTIATGIAAIANVLINWLIRFVDGRCLFFPGFLLANRGLILNVLNMLSHVFGLAISIGKTLSVATRFTAICLMQRKHIWSGLVIPFSLVAMFGIPTVIYIYFPAIPAVFAPTPNGYGSYLGIANPGFLIAKAFATCGYFLFFFTTVPMCVLSVLKLRKMRSQHNLQTSKRSDAILAIYAVILTTSHMIKSIIQTIWFIALVLDLKDLQAFAIGQYLLPNTLSAFSEPVLLILTSPNLRKEVFTCKMRQSTTITNVISNVKRSSDRTSQM